MLFLWLFCFVILRFVCFYFSHIIITSKMTDFFSPRKSECVDPDGRGSGEKLEGVEEGETVFRI